jgi:hypothetical protein
MRLAVVIIAALFTSSLSAQTNVDAPHVLGLAHVAFRVSDFARASALRRPLGL